MASKELLQVSTNSADDSKGIAFGLSGNLFLYIIGGAVVSLLLVILFNGFLKIQILNAVVIGCMPLLISTLYVVFLVNNKPPHYLDDLLQSSIGNDHIEYAVERKQHPWQRT